MHGLLAPDVTAWSDGGGKVTAARRPLYGTDHVARWILGVLAKPVRPASTMEPAVDQRRARRPDRARRTLIGALSFDLADGRIQNLRFQVNPDKLHGVRPAPYAVAAARG